MTATNIGIGSRVAIIVNTKERVYPAQYGQPRCVIPAGRRIRVGVVVDLTPTRARVKWEYTQFNNGEKRLDGKRTWFAIDKLTTTFTENN